MKTKYFILLFTIILTLTVGMVSSTGEIIYHDSTQTSLAAFGEQAARDGGSAAGFTPRQTTTEAYNISLWLKDSSGNGATGEAFTAEIWSEAGNNPNVVVAVSESRALTTTVGYAWYNFTFNSTALNTGNQYFINIRRSDYSVNAVHFPGMGLNATADGGAVYELCFYDVGVEWNCVGSDYQPTMQIWNATIPTPASSNFTITATNIYDATAIQSFIANITHNGSNWMMNTTTGSLTTNITQNTGLVNVTITADNHFTNSTTNHDTVANLNQIMTPWTAIYALDNNSATYVQKFTIIYDGTNYTAINGSADIPLYDVTNANVGFRSIGEYASQNASLNATKYLQNYTFNAYPDPSVVSISIYDADNGNLITQNMTLIVSGVSYEETFNTQTGNIYVGNLTAGIFTFKFSSVNYTTQTYTLTIGANTYQELNAWLSANTSSLRFTLRDWDSGAILESVNTVMQRIINNTWETVENKQTDITGRALFQYVQNVRYRFTISKNGYVSRTFELDPIDPLIAATGYTVRMRKESTITDTSNFAGVTRSISPSRYTEGNQTNNFTLFSPDGAFQSYGITLTYPGGSNSSTGNNPYGENLLTGIEIINPSLGDTVNITYWYDHTTQGNRSYSALYFIDIESTTWTWSKIRDTDYGFTLLEKALIAIFATIFIAGVASYFTGMLGGGITALICFGLFYSIGFLTLWMILPSMFGGLFLIIWRMTA